MFDELNEIIPVIIKDQFGTIQNIQRVLIFQTSNWSGTIFAVSYSKPALVFTFQNPDHNRGFEAIAAYCKQVQTYLEKGGKDLFIN